MNERPRVPVVTLLLIVANIGVSFVLTWQPELLERFAFDPMQPSFQTALTSLFLHVNTVHLLGNMVFLAAVGPAVEQAGSSWRLALTYLAGGLSGIGAHWALEGRNADPSPVVGASGAVVACVAYYSVRYSFIKVPLAPKVNVSIVFVTAAWLVMQVASAFVNIGATLPSQAYWAHGGGFAAGLILSLFFRAPKEARLQQGRAMIARLGERSPGATLSAAEQHLAEHPTDLIALRNLADAKAQVNDVEGESEALCGLLDALPESQQPEIALRLKAIGRLDRLPSLRRALMAERMKESNPEASVALLESIVGCADDPQRPEALYSLALLLNGDDPKRSQALRDELKAEYPMHPASERARLRELES
ncbi:MAG: rhomboid family intramembrane serine protease [Fimbriimonadaceae bacterium]|nr:rhomboid family intramembrane serine protease [Fimbriimonadaceae bacterium]